MTYLFFTNPSNPLVQKPSLQEGLVLATPHHRPHVVRGSENTVGLLREVDAAHGRHVVDVVVPGGGVGAPSLLVPDEKIYP